MSVPELRVRVLRDAAAARDGEYVLYWMIATRRTRSNYALQRAADWASRLGRPLVMLEALRCNYAWASPRMHAFVIDGMRANREALRDRRALYYPYVEPRRSVGAGLVESLAARACVVVTDDYPCFFLPAMIERVARRLRVRFETVDSNGLLPMRAADVAFPTAVAFRRFLQRTLPEHLSVPPAADALERAKLPLLDSLPREVLRQWPAASELLLNGDLTELSDAPLDRSVRPTATPGGSAAAAARLHEFATARLDRYAEDRNGPDEDVSSGLSPYLHFGHISPHDVFAAIARREEWSAARLGAAANGRREGWWGMSAAAEAFLDQLVTWRELGFNMCSQRADYGEYESLPDWARATLEKHAHDKRTRVYSLEQFESASTHDPLWNAAQTQLVREGRIHNYLRMLWGKKIVEWSPDPRTALANLIELNNKYALDGRDPNSYSGIFWVLGRYDRPWGPERPVFGVVRYMSSENTARKMSVAGYLARYGASSFSRG